MRRLLNLSFAVALLALLASAAPAQEQTFTSNDLEYALELPSPTWRVIARPDGVHQHLEFVYGDRRDGHLRVRKELVDAGMTPQALARRDQEQRFRFTPGYVEGGTENFAGRLSGVTVSYEYTSSGRPMLGRLYYLQADNRTIYTLHFSGERDRLLRIRNQTDLISRSFHLK